MKIEKTHGESYNISIVSSSFLFLFGGLSDEAAFSYVMCFDRHLFRLLRTPCTLKSRP